MSEESVLEIFEAMHEALVEIQRLLLAFEDRIHRLEKLDELEKLAQNGAQPPRYRRYFDDR